MPPRGSSASLLILAALVVLVIGALAIFVAARQNLRFEAPYPEVAASSDPAVIERGRYIVRDLAPCAACHGDPDRARRFRGADVPLSGGFVSTSRPVKFYARNITPDAETGSGICGRRDRASPAPRGRR